MVMRIPKRLGTPILTMAVFLLACLLVISSCSKIRQQSATKIPETLIVWSTVDYSSDPISGKTSEQHFLTSLENRTLFRLSKNGKIKNDLATDYSISDNGLTIKITLGNSTFSDGAKVVSSDVKASLARLVRVGGDYAKLLENVKGFGEAKNGGDFFGIQTKSNQKVTFDLITPDAFFVYHLAHPATGILPAASIGTDGEITSNVHSGRYSTKLISNELNSTTVFESREEGLPTINVIRKSEEEIVAKPSMDAVDIILAATAQSNSFKQLSVPQLAIASWNIYVADGDSPFADLRFRKAVLMAMDEKESIAAYSTKAFTPQKFTGDTIDSVKCSVNCKTNTKKAAALVKEVYPDGGVPDITIDIENNEIQQALATSAVKQLAAIGIKATVSSHDATELSNEIARGDVQLFRFGWISDVAIGADQLVNSYKADSTENVSGVADSTLEDKISKYKKATSESEALDGSHAIQERLKDMWLTRPVAHFHQIVTVDKRLKGIEFDFYGRASIEDIRITS